MSDEDMSSNRSDSDTDCDLNPLEDVEDGTNHKITDDDEPKQPAAGAAAAVTKPRVTTANSDTNLWEIFEKIPEEPGIALCRLCHRKLSFRTTITNLKKHINHKHALEIEAGLLPKEGVQVPPTAPSSRRATGPPVYRSKSIAWNYFSVVCRYRRRARCKLCSKIYSYASSVTNLLTHLERCHNNVPLEENGQLQANPTSAVWAYFKCLDETVQVASCLICKKRVDYSDDCRELKRHLVRKHPNVDLEDSSAGKTFMVTDSGDLFEIDVNKSEAAASESDHDENETYEADYLDDTTYDDPEERINKSKIRKRPHAIQQSEKVELSKPKEIQPRTKEVPEDSIDIFGRYIVSLLKKMPKNRSDKLQYQILKQIFEVKSEEATTVKDNNVTSNSEQSHAIIHDNND